MDPLHITLGDIQVMLDHVQGGVTQKALKGHDVTTVAQVLNRKGVTETVRVTVVDTGTFTP